MTKTKFKQTEIGIIPEWWNITNIESIASREKHSLSMGPFGSNITKNNFIANGVPVIRGKNLRSYRFVNSDFVFISEEKADELLSSNVTADDIIVTHRGTLGQVGIIPANSKFKRYVVSQSGMKLTCDSDQVYPYFVFYWLKSPKGQQELLKNISQTGVPAIAQPLSSLRKIILPKPSKQEQLVISKILSDLDSKIELNRKMNQTLEQIAQAIFKSWFVDYKFPDEKGRPYGLSGWGAVCTEKLRKKTPEEWKIKSIMQICDTFGGGTPSTKNPNFWEGNINWAIPSDLTKSDYVFLKDTNRKITEKGLDNCSSKLHPENSIFMTSRASIGYFAINTMPCAANQGFIIIETRNDSDLFYLYCDFKRRVNEFIKNANGTTFLEIGRSTFRKLPILIPPRFLIDLFHKTIYPIYFQIKHFEREIQLLVELRDLLLPKLMSGKIRVQTGAKK